MKFIHTDLGHCSGNEIVKIELSAGANVRLMTHSNFLSYRRGGQYRFHGGLARKSPLSLSVPSSGHWHAVVDMEGLRGRTSVSVRLVA